MYGRHLRQFANHRESISRRLGLEHLDTPPANVMHYSVCTDEYWQFFNPLDDDDAVTMDTPQHTRAAGTGPHGLREVRVVNARPTPSTTHSGNGTDDVAAQWLLARRARSVRRRGGGAGCDDARLMAGGTSGLLLPSPGARVWFPMKAVASGKASKLSAFHLGQ
jgi:hypothetical protein